MSPTTLNTCLPTLKLTVGVFEDAPNIAHRFKTILERAGHKVHVVSGVMKDPNDDGWIYPASDMFPASQFRGTIYTVEPFSLNELAFVFMDNELSGMMNGVDARMQNAMNRRNIPIIPISSSPYANERMGSPMPGRLKVDTLVGLEKGTLSLEQLLAESGVADLAFLLKP